MERIFVTVRARPLSIQDAKTSPWKISSNSISFSSSSSSSLKFDFDRIFGEQCRTREVYEARTKEIVNAAVRGFNGTVFAYGQTNSGKTHTMRGSVTEPGVIPLAVRDLFDIIQEVPDREFLLRMSYMEIYNEEINDLLAPEHRRLQIHESLDRGIFVAGLREEIVASPEQVLDLMEFGESHRHIGETNMNLHSSRSHTIFRMIIESRDKTGDEDSEDSCDAVRVSVLNLVDLAGSERAAKTGAEGVRLKEGSHINKSLMTLGTVIKKLSEGAESQGGHVPYRDSKLTRILQPALGGNANTAIICNITLAQIHADETKSSLQFASRALRVTNCARVNEILTDAALLKRQKTEIEELRAKLKASHSEHLEEEILSLRNTLLQTELERERIALELEEEKRAQVEREKMLEEQAKKIKNLSSMVLYSSRDETRDRLKKDKRRDTWCPGKLARENNSKEALDSKASDKKERPKREQGSLLPFEELVIEDQTTNDISSNQTEDYDETVSDACLIPNPCTLMKVTSRRKAPQKKSLPVEKNELCELRAEYEDLLLKFESQKIFHDVQIDCLKRTLMEANLRNFDDPAYFIDNSVDFTDKNMHSVDKDPALLIQELKEQIKELEREKSSNEQNLESIMNLAKANNTHATEKYEELSEALQKAREEARAAHAQLSEKYDESTEEKISNLVTELREEVQQTFVEVQSLKAVSESIFSVMGEVIHNHATSLDQISDFKSYTRENSILLKSIFNDYRTMTNALKNRITKLEEEKIKLQETAADIEEQMRNAQNSEKALTDLSEQYESDKSELLSHIEMLEREVFSLSTSSLSREKESLRKDLEKTKTKLKDTESKLKNTMQEKTRLEGEKANAEKEIKRLNGQKALLERDICKRESLAGRRRDSVVDRSRALDSKKTRVQESNMQLTMQEDYKKLEVLAFEMETTIAALDEELAVAKHENEDLLARFESLSSEHEMLSDKLEMSNTELNTLQEEILNLRLELENSEASHEKLVTQLNIVTEEKDELATQLTNGLLELEEERAVWSAKEKASIEAIKEKADVYNDEVTSLSNELSKVRDEMSSLKKEYDILYDRLKAAEELAQLEKTCSIEMSSKIDELKRALELADSEKRASEELLTSKLDALSLEHSCACEEVKKSKADLATLRKERDDFVLKIQQDTESDILSEFQMTKSQLHSMRKEREILISQIKELQENQIQAKHVGTDNDEKLLRARNEIEQLAKRFSDMENKISVDEVKSNKERAKLRMRVKCTQQKLDAFRERYKEAIEEQQFMHKKFEEASTKLKDRVTSYAIEALNLKKQLAASTTR